MENAANIHQEQCQEMKVIKLQTDTIHLLRQSALDFLQVRHSQNYWKWTPRMTATQVHHPVMKLIKTKSKV